jgi:hypothetical protein
MALKLASGKLSSRALKEIADMVRHAINNEAVTIAPH